MSERVYDQSFDFACAYIQTLPHVKKRDEFESDDEYEKYLDYRQELYFSEYMRSVNYAQNRFKEMDSKADEEN